MSFLTEVISISWRLHRCLRLRSSRRARNRLCIEINQFRDPNRTDMQCSSNANVPGRITGVLPRPQLLTIDGASVFAQIDVHAIVEIQRCRAVSASKHRFRGSKLHQYPSVSRRSSAVRTGTNASRGCRSQRDLVSTLQLLSEASRKWTSCLWQRRSAR